MSIATRIAAIQEHLESAYDKLEDFGIDLSIVDKNIDNIATKLEEIYDEYPKVTGTGTEVTLNNTKAARMNLGITGRTTQESTTQSANLFDEEYYNNASLYSTATYKYVLTRIKGKRTLYVRAVLKDGKTAISGLYVAFTTHGSNPNQGLSGYIVNNGENNTRQVDFTNNENIYFSFYPTNTNINTIFDTYNIMVSTDNVAYVPFVPDSPSPNYPQDIKNTGDNVNLFDKDSVLLETSLASNGLPQANAGSVTSDFMQVKEKTSYYLSRVRGGNFARTYAFYNESKELISINYISGGEDVSGAVTTPNGTKYMRVVSGTDYYEECKVEQGTKATPYSSYGCGNVNEKIQNKNLAPFTNQDFTLNGVRYYVQNGNLYMNGTSIGETNSTNQNFKNNFSFKLKAGTYYMERPTNNIAPPVLYKKSDNTVIKNTTGIFTLTEETEVSLGFYIYNKTYDNQLIDIMISQGSTASSYVSHEEQNLSFPLAEGQKLMEDGTITDGKVINEWGEYVFTGNENLTMDRPLTNSNRFYTSTIIPTALNNVSISNYFINSSVGSINSNDKEALTIVNGTQIAFRINKDIASTVQELKALLAEWYANGNPLRVQFHRVTPVEEAFTSEQQTAWEEIKKAKSYDEVTIIESTDETPATVTVAALMKGE